MRINIVRQVRYQKTTADIFRELKHLGPMCAMEYDSSKHNTEGWIEQPKMMGVRGLIYEDTVLSKLGNELEGVSRGRFYSDEVILDGEFYRHGMSQQDIVSAVKNPLSPHNKDIEFWAFDVVMPGVSARERQEKLQEVHRDLQNPRIVLTPTYNLYSKRSILGPTKLLGSLLTAGYEGAIFRDPLAWYKYGEQPHLLKLKAFKEMNVNVCDRYEGEGKYVEMLGGFYCETDDNKPVNVGGGFTDEERKFFWNLSDANLPRRIEIKFQYLSADGIPVHPQFSKVLPSI